MSDPTLTPIDFPAEFARIRSLAEAHFVALEDLLDEANVLRDVLLLMHPEVSGGSDEQVRLEELYGYSPICDIANALD